MTSARNFPRLTDENHQVTSPASAQYNCIAWAVGDTERWWQPGVYCPTEALSNDFGIGVLEQALLALGFEDCDHGDDEPGIEKVALYGSSLFYTHAARQLADGRWTSKLGKGEDIEHDSPDDVAGGVYGDVVQFMRRRIQAPS